MEKMVWTQRLGACPRIESLLGNCSRHGSTSHIPVVVRKSHFGPFFCSFSLNMSNYSPQMTKEMDSKWLPLATASILGQAPRLLVILIPLLLAACAGQPPVKVEGDEVDARVRAPASEDSAGVQVYSLQNPAVKELTAQAVVAERAGELDQRPPRVVEHAEQQLADPDIYTEASKQKLQDCLLKKADVDKRCEAIEEEWMEASEALEALSNSL